MNSLQLTRVVEAFDESLAKMPSDRLVMNVATGLLMTTSRLASATQGRNVMFVTNGKPAVAVRKGLYAAAGTVTLVATGMIAKQLATRVQVSSVGTRKVVVKTTDEMLSEVKEQLFIAACTVLELSAGRTLLTRRRFSALGMIAKTASLAESVYTVVGNGRHLYERREEWLPQMQIELMITLAEVQRAAGSAKSKTAATAAEAADKAKINEAFMQLVKRYNSSD